MGLSFEMKTDGRRKWAERMKAEGKFPCGRKYGAGYFFAI
jgi:hypothetical protein